MQSVLQLDNPWRRLPWVLPIAVLVWALLLWELGQILQRPPQKANDSAPIEAELVEIPPPVVEKVVEPPAKVKAEPKHVPVVKSAEPPRVRLQREAEPQPVTPSPAVPVTPEPPPQSVAAPAPAPSGDLRSAGTANMGARAIVRPLPQIPDELREEAFNVVAVARFQISADGSATFELSKPTPNPRLNRLLLEKLKEWRFFPAMRDGKPVASTQEIRINLEVK